MPARASRSFAPCSNAWQARSGRHLGRYGYDEVRRWARLFAEQGVLDASVLRISEQPIAYTFGTRIGEWANSYHTAYDERHRDLSPGFLLKAFHVKDAEYRPSPRSGV